MFDPSALASREAVTHAPVESIAAITEVRQSPSSFSVRIKETAAFRSESRLRNSTAVVCGFIVSHKERLICFSNGIDDSTSYMLSSFGMNL